MIVETKRKSTREAEFKRLFNSARATEEKGKQFLVDAKVIYLKAKALNYDKALVEGKLLRLNGKIENAFDEFTRHGNVFFRAEAYQMALDNFNQALRIKPNDTNLKKQVAACKKHL